MLTRKAKSDLRSIALHSEKKWGREQRYTYIKQFDDTFQLLANKPSIGQSCDYIKKGYRKFPNSSHLIFYRCISNAQIEIVRILHKRMDVRVQLTDS
nr:type II toxin-antitoxin system RelE/ParE family toxin [Methylomarinum sp. Ch1-1]MDP4519142.1 type II toxin-antitoxin system RelE/ParE family toxin [Methylomarinum sp. Ch1-1]